MGGCLSHDPSTLNYRATKWRRLLENDRAWETAIVMVSVIVSIVVSSVAATEIVVKWCELVLLVVVMEMATRDNGSHLIHDDLLKIKIKER